MLVVDASVVVVGTTVVEDWAAVDVVVPTAWGGLGVFGRIGKDTDQYEGEDRSDSDLLPGRTLPPPISHIGRSLPEDYRLGV